MTHAEKQAKLDDLNLENEAAAAKARAIWIGIMEMLAGLNPVTANAVRNSIEDWHDAANAWNRILDQIARLQQRMALQMEFPTPESHPGTVAGPPKTLKGPAAAKSLSPKSK
jgi:hypothetical protein